jgi:hypothetical protein
MAIVRGQARRPMRCGRVQALPTRQYKVSDLPLSSCADDDSLCAWVAFAGRSGRSHDVQSADPVGAVSAEQYLVGLAHRPTSPNTPLVLEARMVQERLEGEGNQ